MKGKKLVKLVEENLLNIVVGLGLTAVVVFGGNAVHKHDKYVLDHTFTGTAIVQEDSLRTNNRLIVEYKGKPMLIKYYGGWEDTRDLATLVKEGTKIKFTGYTDKTMPNKIVSNQIELE